MALVRHTRRPRGKCHISRSLANLHGGVRHGRGEKLRQFSVAAGVARQRLCQQGSGLSRHVPRHLAVLMT